MFVGLITLAGMLAACTAPEATTTDAAAEQTDDNTNNQDTAQAQSVYTHITQGTTPDGQQALGESTAPLVIDMYSDFLCETCAYHVQHVEPVLIYRYVQHGQLRLVYHHVVQVGPNSQIASEAAECAADQGRFWEMRRALYRQNQDLYGNDVQDVIIQIAGEVGLDQAALQTCLENDRHAAFIEANQEQAAANGIRSRPVFDIADQRIVGTLPPERFEALINASLEQQ
jgi:protein-disulfide isomerase